MTEVIEEGVVELVGALGVKIPVKSGETEERVFELVLGERVTTILDMFASERGCPVEELVLEFEGGDKPLTEGSLIDANYPHKRRHHVHHVGNVAVTVFYQAGQEKRDFRRSATIDQVLAWALLEFKIDPSMATEFELTRHGQKEELPGSEHVGHLTGRNCDLALDLVRGDIANGASV